MLAFSQERLQEEIEGGYVSARRHPSDDLVIYNYTPSAVYSGRWNPVTLACRGLVLDANGDVVARPFPKFFNWGEHGAGSQLGDVPLTEGFEAFEKLDGSLGISYRDSQGQVAIATRGSFESEQAFEGTRILRHEHRDALPLLDPTVTYLFEILYPENRIVVDYGGVRELVLLGAFETRTGREVSLRELSHLPFRQPQVWSDRNVNELLKDDRRNFEGYVLRFESGFRVKVKLDEYVRLHRVVTRITPLSVWRMLAAGDDLNEVLRDVPNEFFQEYDAIETGLRRQFNEVRDRHMFALESLGLDGLELRRDIAQRVLQRAQTGDVSAGVLFGLLDDKDVSEAIWKLVRPRGE